jgi:hypothetical protein
MTPCCALALLSTIAVTSAHADIYKCVGKGPLPVYQNFRCEFDSAAEEEEEDAMPASRTEPTTAAKPGMRAAAKASATPSAASIPRVGMTAIEVRAIWGKPRDTSDEEHADADVEVWTYADSRSVRFDRKHRVTVVRW